MNQRIAQIKIAVLMTMLAGLTMGNESCQKANDRVLKIDVDLGSIAAQKVIMPSGEKIDFSYVANALFYQEVMANSHFIISNPIPTPATTLGSGGPSKLSLSQKIAVAVGMSSLSNDDQLMQDFGFADELRRKAAVNLNSKVNGLTAESTDEEMPACLYNLPQAKLAGEVVSFEANFGAGLSLGYGANGSIGIPAGVGGSVKFSSARLQLGLRAVDPLNDLIIASAKGISHQSSVNFGLNLASPNIGFDFFFKTPIASVVAKGIDKSLDAIVADISKQNSTTGSWADAWESRVVYDKDVANGDTQIMIRGGSRYGLQKGDTFTVTNMHYAWTGAACASALRYKVPTTATPVANVEVIAVGDNVSVARVTQYLIEERIRPGAQVKILKMVTANPK